MVDRRRTIRVENLARVQGRGSVRVEVAPDKTVRAELRLVEPPRLFEALLRGRHFSEAPDITARICGICPVAYQITACQAIEQACDVVVEEPVRDLRRLLSCGEWIESHALHVYMLHAPDFLGYDSAIAMARDHGDVVERGLALKAVGNAIIRVVGGREIHPVNVRVGGFYRIPAPADVVRLRERLLYAREAAYETVRWVAGFAFPDVDLACELVALRDPEGYPLTGVRITSTEGLDISVPELEEHVAEEQRPYTYALQAQLAERGAYLTGPLARYSLNAGLLSGLAHHAAQEAGLDVVCRNPYRSIIVRAVELVQACDEALRLVDRYRPPERAAVTVRPRAATGVACSEAPRGVLYHRYVLDADGTITDAKIMAPTSQNQRVIEEDLRVMVRGALARPRAELERACERVVRCYDPCISCATHFLTLEIAGGSR